MALKYKYPYLSIDHLKMGLIRSKNIVLAPMSDSKALTDYLSQMKYRCLVMSESYIQHHYCDIRANANIVEARLDDSDCTMESLILDNAEALKMCRKYGVDYLLIDETYPVDADIE